MKINYGYVSERDMDVLFLNAFGLDKGFLRLFTDKTELPKADYSIEEIYLSKSDKDGESDITVIIEGAGKRYGLLIEDKIDAQAMPDQQKRYIIRGEKGIKKHEYDGFYDFIICSEKYYEINSEAKKYMYHVFYEECVEYFERSDIALADAWVQLIRQAITKSKRHSETEINEASNMFYNKYKDYQELNYPALDLRTDRGSNGFWAYYATRYKSVYIYHKMPQGYVDLTFPNASIKMDGLYNMVRTLNEYLGIKLKDHGLKEITTAPAGKSGVLRIDVPKLNVERIRFEDVNKEDINKCFYAVSILSEYANMLASADNVTDIG